MDIMEIEKASIMESKNQYLKQELQKKLEEHLLEKTHQISHHINIQNIT